MTYIENTKHILVTKMSLINQGNKVTYAGDVLKTLQYLVQRGVKTSHNSCHTMQSIQDQSTLSGVFKSWTSRQL